MLTCWRPRVERKPGEWRLLGPRKTLFDRGFVIPRSAWRILYAW